MRPCVLVHGGWCGGWHWDEVSGRLRARGIDVYVPTLTGMAERVDEALPDTGLHTHIDDVTNLLERHDLRDVVLVGHSYGGAVITGVAHGRCRYRVGDLVYLDAFVPQEAESLGDIMGSEFVAASKARAELAGTPHLVPPMFDVRDSVGWTGEKAEAHAARLCSTPLATATDILQFLGPSTARKTYVACTAQPLGLFDSYAETAKSDADWTYFELPCPHDVVQTMPGVVAGIVETFSVGD
jgi:pimeloyl-ACP methyl ester carboxylesterase